MRGSLRGDRPLIRLAAASRQRSTFSHKGRRESEHREKTQVSCRFPLPPLVLNPNRHSSQRGPITTVIAETTPASTPARWVGRILSGLVIVFLLFDGAIKLVPWPIVTETMDRMGYGSSDALMRGLGAITIVCTVLYAVPPTSILGAILLTGYLGGAIASHVRIDSPLFTNTLFGLYLGLMLWGGLWLRDDRLRRLIPFRR
jgi:hypothetical protein